MKWLPQHLLTTAQSRISYSKNAAAVDGASAPFDLCTADGVVTETSRINNEELSVTISFDLHQMFVPLHADVAPEFNLKSSLTQLGVDATGSAITIDKVAHKASCKTTLIAVGPLARLALDEIVVGTKIGKLFAPDTRRKIISLEYLERLKGAVDLRGQALLKFAGANLDLKLIEGRVVAMLPLQPGTITYDSGVHSLLPTIGKALASGTNYKRLLKIHQHEDTNRSRFAAPGNPLLVRTVALRLRTVFARVVDELLPKGITCTRSNILEPDFDTKSDSAGRTFVFRGESLEELTHIPLEFYSLEAYREHVPFELRKTLASSSRDVSYLLDAFATAPEGCQACTYVCKGSMFRSLNADDWITSDPVKDPYVDGGVQQQQKAENYMFQQCEYGLLSAISVGEITSDGVLLTRFFPSPVLKSLLLARQVCKRVRAIYFLQASRSFGSFFSQEDRALLNDLNTFGIDVFHVDVAAKKMFQFTKRAGVDSGLMLPLDKREDYLKATVFGVYGSNLVAGSFDLELDFLLKGLLTLKSTGKHPKMNPDVPLAMMTGGGPGAMEVGNRVAVQNGFLSCGMFVDFGSLARKPGANINEQKKNPYVEAYMTYRPSNLVERQSEFNLDFPIFLVGGIGTDFEFALEEVRRKVGTVAIHPMVLFGDPAHWGAKITGRFQENYRSGTIKGSEWLSNVSYVVATGKQALAVYKKFFEGTLEIGGKAPANDRGFVIVDDAFVQSAGL